MIDKLSMAQESFMCFMRIGLQPDSKEIFEKVEEFYNEAKDRGFIKEPLICLNCGENPKVEQLEKDYLFRCKCKRGKNFPDYEEALKSWKEAIPHDR